MEADPSLLRNGPSTFFTPYVPAQGGHKGPQTVCGQAWWFVNGGVHLAASGLSNTPSLVLKFSLLPEACWGPRGARAASRELQSNMLTRDLRRPPSPLPTSPLLGTLGQGHPGSRCESPVHTCPPLTGCPPAALGHALLDSRMDCGGRV